MRTVLEVHSAELGYASPVWASCPVRRKSSRKKERSFPPSLTLKWADDKLSVEASE